MTTTQEFPFFHHVMEENDLLSLDDIQNSFIYIENNFRPEHNAYIKQHYDELRAICNSHGEEFIYFPRLYQEVLYSEAEKYNDPSQVNLHRSIETPKDMVYLNRILNEEGFLTLDFDRLDPFQYYRVNAMLLHHYEKEDDSSFIGYEISNHHSETIPDILRHYYDSKQDAEEEESMLSNTTDIPSLDQEWNSHIRHCSTQILKASIPDNYRYSTSEDVETYDADYHFDEESKKLVDEVRARLDALRLKGFSNLLLRKILSEPQQLSTLVVTSDYRILLPDYKMEVKMKPLPKAVYFLFLTHPEGIRFKDLGDYRSELQHIYLRITHRTSDEKIRCSLDNLCNPMDNSINEKCARIREAFVGLMDDSIARYYYISGNRGESKRIILGTGLRDYSQAQFGQSIYDILNEDLLGKLSTWLNNKYGQLFGHDADSNQMLKEILSTLRRVNNKRINNMKMKLLQEAKVNSFVDTSSLLIASIDDTEKINNLIHAAGDAKDQSLWTLYNSVRNHQDLVKEYIQNREWMG